MLSHLKEINKSPKVFISQLGKPRLGAQENKQGFHKRIQEIQCVNKARKLGLT
jgi:hypothetical protein